MVETDTPLASETEFLGDLEPWGLSDAEIEQAVQNARCNGDELARRVAIQSQYVRWLLSGLFERVEKGQNIEPLIHQLKDIVLYRRTDDNL
jgi:hypothetical protein